MANKIQSKSEVLKLFKLKTQFFLGMLLGSCLSSAESQKPLPPAQTLEQRLIQRNIEISEWFDGVADGIDLFLVGKRVTKGQNTSRVTIENITYSMERRSLKNNTSIGVFPRFPNLEKYWALKFTTYDEKEDRRTVARNTYTQRNSRRRNYGATVAWYRRFGSVKTTFEPRIELQDPLKISHSLGFETVADLETYEFNPKLEFYASASRGPGVSQALNFNYFISKKTTLTFINQGNYLDKTRVYLVNNGFYLGQIISKKSTLSYAFIFNSNNKPNYHLDGYVASIGWNELVYKRIFDYTISPYLEFTRATSFKGQVGATLNLRLNF